MLHKLYKLASIISKLDRYRFYAASLLFIYDGDYDAQRQYEVAALSRRFHKPAIPPTEPEGARRLGPTKITDTLSLAPHSFDHEASRDTRISSPPSHLRSTSTNSTRASQSHHLGEVNIRLIDFAHCSTGDDFILPDEPVKPEDPDRPRATFPPSHPNQPDCGFLLGLKSLCAALKEMWDNERRRQLESMGSDLGPMNVSGADVWEVCLSFNFSQCFVVQSSVCLAKRRSKACRLIEKSLSMSFFLVAVWMSGCFCS